MGFFFETKMINSSFIIRTFLINFFHVRNPDFRLHQVNTPPQNQRMTLRERKEPAPQQQYQVLEPVDQTHAGRRRKMRRQLIIDQVRIIKKLVCF